MQEPRADYQFDPRAGNNGEPEESSRFHQCWYSLGNEGCPIISVGIGTMLEHMVLDDAVNTFCTGSLYGVWVYLTKLLEAFYWV